MQHAHSDRYSANIASAFEALAQECPGTAAIVAHDQTVTFAVLHDWVLRVTRHLKDQGVQPGDLVAYTLSQQVLILVTLLAVGRLGACSFCIPASRTASQKSAWLLQAQARHFVTDNPRDTDLPYGVKGCALSWSLLTAKPSHLSGLDCQDSKSPFLLAMSSGSTGLPKLIPVNHDAMFHRLNMLRQYPSYREGQRFLCFSGVEFSSVQNLMLGVLYNRGCYVFSDLVDVTGTLRRHGVNHVRAAVSHLEQLLSNLPSADRAYWRRLQCISTVGSTVSMDLRQRFSDYLNSALHVLYASNESHLISYSYSDSTFTVPGTVGIPLKGVEVQIVDSFDQPRLSGEPGLIRVRSKLLVQGYQGPGSDELNARHFRGGWFYPGDLGKIQADGQLIFLGRADNMMIRNGINIYPAEIEQGMTALPGVKAAIAFPLRHPVHQDLPVCVVEPQPDVLLDATRLRQQAIDMMGFKAPAHVLVMPEIPRNANGKVSLSQLRALFRDFQ